MPSLVCPLLLAALASSGAPLGDPGAAAPASTRSTIPTSSTSSTSSTWRSVGVGLAATGAALAVGGSVGFVLVEGLTRPDRLNASDDDAADDAARETFTQAGGFVAVAVASASAALLLGGGGLILADVVAEERGVATSTGEAPGNGGG